MARELYGTVPQNMTSYQRCVTLPIADREAAADYRLAFLEKRRRDLGDILDWAPREKEWW